MARFLIDANLPYRFNLWQGQDYLHVFDLSDTWPDRETWRYAREQELTIVTTATHSSSNHTIGAFQVSHKLGTSLGTNEEV